MKTALLVIDVQNTLVDGNPYEVDTIIENIKSLISNARDKGMEVIYVQHDGGKGSVLERGSVGWNIYSEIVPTSNEVVFEKKFNSAFRNTALKEYLDDNSIDRVIITGMQTDYCIDTSCKVAFEYGYKIIIPEMTNTTFDNGLFKAEDIYKHYNYKIFKDRFADLITVDEVIDIIRG